VVKLPAPLPNSRSKRVDAIQVGERRGLRRLGVVERHDVLALLLAVEPRERVDARLAAREAMLLGAVAQRRVRPGQVGEALDLLVQRVIGVEVVVRRRRVGADVVVLAGVVADVVVLRVLAGEHVLPRRLVVAGAGEALLVAEVDDRVAAREVHQLVGELVTCQQFGLGRPGRVVVADEHPDVAHVVVAEERGQLGGVRVRVRVVIVVAEEGAQPVGRLRLRGEVARRVLEREVEHRLDAVVGRVVGGELPRGVDDLAEHEEVRLALGLRVAHERGRELLPELVVDVLHRVDAEAVDLRLAHPRLVDVDHAVDDLRVLGEEVVEAEEVAVLRVLAGERRVPAVVVQRHVVEPRRVFGKSGSPTGL
jgi:hypothetical protein